MIAPILTKQQINVRVREMALAIDKQYPQGITIVCAMTGAMFFVVDLSRHITVPVCIELIVVGSYPGKTLSSQGAYIHYAQPSSLHGKDVLIVDDIADTGRTMSALRTAVAVAAPRSVRTMVLIQKRLVNPIDYVGFFIDRSDFVVGYGLDYDGLYRNLPYIGVYDAERNE